MADGLNAMASLIDLDGEIAIVTGAGRGIGAATARALSKYGARVAVATRRRADAESIMRDLPAGRALAVACDVAEPAQIDELVAETTRRLGAPTLLINNAGVIAPIGPLHTLEPESFAAAIRTTLVGAAFAARAVLPHMVRAGRGVIVNLSSGAAHRPLEGWTAYCAGKAGLAMLTRSLALEYGEQGVRVVGFAPGLVDTGMQAEIRASGINAVSRLPRESLGSTEEPAEAIAFLCSSGGAVFAGGETDIRAPAFRAAAGLKPLEGTQT
jgi:NAD(P)-dependent dehydrogenase (short-subunit alcohol dehydrogenase family)